MMKLEVKEFGVELAIKKDMEEMKVNFERSIQNLLKDNEESARIVRE